MNDQHYLGNEFEALRTNLNNHVSHIRYLTQVDLRIFAGYITLQLVFAGWLVKNPIDEPIFKVGLLIIEITLSTIAYLLLFHNYKRREEIVETLENINLALGFNVDSAYIKGVTINAKTKENSARGFKPWVWFYFAGVWAIALGVSLVLITS